MTRARLDGLIVLLMGSVVFLMLGSILESSTPKAMNDFKASYYGARCLIQGCDPYNRSDLTRLYHSEEGERPADSDNYRLIATTNVYLPASLTFMLPLAFLGFGPAHVLWIVFIAASFLVACFLMWDFAAGYSPILSGCLVGFHIANSQLLIFTGNPAGIAVSLSIVAAWCFLRQRFVYAGALCLAVGLIIKPHDAGLVWLFFLLAGGAYRKRALQTLVVVIALSLPATLWVAHLSPHWVQEVRSNLIPLSAPGSMNDPGPASSGAHGLGMITDLQTVVSVFWNDPHIYNTASYLICGPLLLVWAFITFRKLPSSSGAWFGLAAIAALSMLPFYHRQYDAKLILLTVPACALAWTSGGLTGRLALVINAVGFVVIGDLPWAIFLGNWNMLHLAKVGLSGRALTMLQVFPVPLALLAMGTFYLWLYWRWSPASLDMDKRQMRVTQSLNPT